MGVNDWFYPQYELTRAGWESVVDNAREGWQYTGLRVASIVAGQELTLDELPVERIIVPLSGSFEVSYTGSEINGAQRLVGRANVFEGPTDVLYLSSGLGAMITGEGRFAVAEAPTDEVFPVAYIPRESVAIEMRGAGSTSRQVHNFGTPASLDASRIIVCEVITPAGNWSSYPPHKHDEYVAGKESQLEEIYYFETAIERGSSKKSDVDPMGYMRNYSSPAGEIDTLSEVRSGDIALVPFGWHGPCIAAPGYDMYYLNVMAGPGPERTWLICDDPAHAWVRDTWLTQDVDSRLPYGSLSDMN
ncbi:MAG: 5-deoxy-glucuronate isomerase [Actinomycetes bacterium]